MVIAHIWFWDYYSKPKLFTQYTVFLFRHCWCYSSSFKKSIVKKEKIQHKIWINQCCKWNFSFWWICFQISQPRRKIEISWGYLASVVRRIVKYFVQKKLITTTALKQMRLILLNNKKMYCLIPYFIHYLFWNWSQTVAVVYVMLIFEAILLGGR